MAKAVSNPGFALRNWYSTSDGFAVVLGPISLHVIRKGASWVGEVRTVSSNVGVTLVTTQKYRSVGSAQTAIQDLAREILIFTSSALEALTTDTTKLPKA